MIMPATYAHYRFGKQALGKMPPESANCAKLFRRLFDVGLHGPDIFFYHGRLTAEGRRIHHTSGKALFAHICARLRSCPTPAGNAYLYGMLCHYALDTTCHPLIIGASELGFASHVEIESEFDRFLLEKDGVVSPSTHDNSAHILLTPDEVDCIAPFYPEIRPKALHRCVKNMRLANKILSTPKGLRRKLVVKTLHLAGPISQHLLPEVADPKYRDLNKRLLARYNQALGALPVLLEKLQAHLNSSTPLGPEFDRIFG